MFGSSGDVNLRGLSSIDGVCSRISLAVNSERQISKMSWSAMSLMSSDLSTPNAKISMKLKFWGRTNSYGCSDSTWYLKPSLHTMTWRIGATLALWVGHLKRSLKWSSSTERVASFAL